MEGSTHNKLERIKEKFTEVRNRSVFLTEPLEQEDFVVQSTLDISPPKWHLAHTTWFWEEFVLKPQLPEYKVWHPRYSYIFNSYYNTVGKRIDRNRRGELSRPSVSEIFEYRAYVDRWMEKLLDTDCSEIYDLIEIGINHEEQHQELLLTDIKYILGHNPLMPAYHPEFAEYTPQEYRDRFIKTGEGLYSVGSGGNRFSFDNERGRHRVFLNDFSISEDLVTNGEFLEFIDSGEYSNPVCWHSDGWTWVQENRISSPLYWFRENNEWMRYSLSGPEQINWEEPVTHVSYYEAAAFAEFAGMRLPTEFEWEISSDRIRWGQRWEHTNSAYLPYPGYKKAAGAIGEYNGKFMINQMVLRGASIATPIGHSRSTYRNFFHPDLRWQFNGIRLCKQN